MNDKQGCNAPILKASRVLCRNCKHNLGEAVENLVSNVVVGIGI